MSRGSALGMVAGCALLVAACGGGEPAKESGAAGAAPPAEQPAPIETAAAPAPAAAPTDAESSLAAVDPSDAAAVASLGSELGLTLESLAEAVPHRGSSAAAAIEPLWPRGDVRLADLTDYRVDVTVDFEPGGNLEFRKGKTVLWSQAFEPEEMTTLGEMPAQVLSELKKGDRISWGYFPAKGKPVKAEFEVVDPDLEKRWASLEKRLADQDPAVAAQYRAQLLLDKGLCVGALHEAWPIAEEGDDPAAWAIVQSALRKLDLDKTGVWEEVQARIVSREPGKRAKEFRSGK